MRALSKATVALIDELHRVAADRGGSRGSTATEVAARLQRIAEAREPLAIPRIIALTLEPRRELAEMTGETVVRLRALVATRDLAFFDQAFRSVSPWTHPGGHPWCELRPSDVRTLAALRAGPTLVQLAMCHPSGYVREEAIRRSAMTANGSEIGFLLLRTNDWVSPVRERARAALRARMTLEHVPDLVAALPIVDAMPRWGRAGPTHLLREIEALLADPRSTDSLIEGVSSSDRFVRRGAYRRLFERDRGDPVSIASTGPYRSVLRSPGPSADLIRAATRDPDPAIRSWAQRWLISTGEDVFLRFYEQLLRSPLGAVRLGAAQRRRDLALAIPWSELLLDSHAGVRALAQLAALEAGANPDDEYRACLDTSQGARLGAALVGLSETGGAGDAELVRGYLRSDRAVVRRSALRALASFDVDDLVPLALAALLDDGPTVTRAASQLLSTRIAAVDPKALWSAFTRPRALPARRPPWP